MPAAPSTVIRNVFDRIVTPTANHKLSLLCSLSNCRQNKTICEPCSEHCRPPCQRNQALFRRFHTHPRHVALQSASRVLAADLLIRLVVSFAGISVSYGHLLPKLVLTDTEVILYVQEGRNNLQH